MTGDHALRQRSPAWFQARCGHVTASRVGDLIARTKTGWSASRTAYMSQLLSERLTGASTLIPPTPVMRWGSEQEPLARAAFSFRTDLEVEAIGYVAHPRIACSGASLDGVIGVDGLLEIKCPTTAVHLETLAGGEAPSKHLPQIQWQLACTGRAWCDGQWRGSSGLSLHDYCQGISSMKAIEQMEKDHPEKF